MPLPLPRDKHDTQHAQALIALPWDDIAPAMPQILEWVQLEEGVAEVARAILGISKDF